MALRGSPSKNFSFPCLMASENGACCFLQSNTVALLTPSSNAKSRSENPWLIIRCAISTHSFVYFFRVFASPLSIRSIDAEIEVSNFFDAVLVDLFLAELFFVVVFFFDVAMTNALHQDQMRAED